MAQSYRVVAPYVTLKVKDPAGADVLVGFYEGAVVENIEADSLKSHLDKGMLEKVSATKAAEPESRSSKSGNS
jgi:hypothetical protein